MESIDKVIDILDDFYKQGYSSYDGFRYLKDANILDNVFKQNNMKELLRNDFNEFFSILFNPNYPHYLKGIKLEEMLYNFGNYVQFILCLYCDNECAYRNLPLLFKCLIEKLDLYKYSSIPINTIKARLYDVFTIEDRNDPNLKKYVFEIKGKICSDKYNKYDSIYDFDYAQIYDVEAFSVWGEHRTLDEENRILKNHPQKPIWVARYNGDGYGYDIYSHDINVAKEKIVEAKTGGTYTFSLTENETNVMRNAHFYNAIYQVNKYTIVRNEDVNHPYVVETDIYTYQPEYDRLIDERGEFYNIHKYRNQENKIMYSVRYDKQSKPKTKIFI